MAGAVSLHANVLAAAVSAHAARKAQIGMYVGVARVALIVYDILICLGRESRYVWNTKFRVSSVLYYAVRYPVLAYQIFSIAYTPTTPQVSLSICNIHTVASSRIVLTSPTSCDTISQFCFTLSTTFTRIAIVLSFIMRAYVVVPKVFIAYLAIGFLAVVGLMSIILDVVQTAQMSCTEASNPLPPPAFVVTFLSLLVFDVLSSALITWGVIRMISDMGGFRRLSSQHIGKLIIRSGALYFFIITGLQIASIVIYWLPQGVYSLVLNNWLITLSAVLVTHFLLDLRELVHGRTENSGSSSNLPTMAFAKSPGAKKDGFDISLGLVDDFTDDTFELTDTSGVRTQDDREWARHAGGDESAQVTSMAWPLEDLAARARRVEEELGFTEQL
ncbi:unnamed protein product [Peniophora sp. CBMAI 1063]|nr:unnamed protein product [Peniophora sp. CBMAI 1063]